MHYVLKVRKQLSCQKLSMIYRWTVDEIYDVILFDRQVKVHEITEVISIERIHFILHNEWNMKKLFVRWVSRLLIAEQKRCEHQSTVWRCLRKVQRISAFCETWIHHYTSVRKMMASVFWNPKGIIIDYLEKKKSLLVKVKVERDSNDLDFNICCDSEQHFEGFNQRF